MAKGKQYSPNDQRSNVKNSNNRARAADVANRIALGHQNVASPAPRKEPGTVRRSEVKK